MWRLMCVVLCFGLWFWRTAGAIPPDALPAPLVPWAEWVLHDQPEHGCPFAHDDFQSKQCLWPGPLQLQLESDGGRFAGDWTLYRRDWLELPGDERHWPQAVSADRQALPVLIRNGKPAVYLPAGRYRIAGEFRWQQLPEQLALPEIVGPLQLSVAGLTIPYPTIEQGAVWPRADAGGTGQDRLDVQVFRQIIDDIPLQVLTRLDLEVSGAAREIALPLALLPGLIPVELTSPLPARLDGDGRLWLQLRPGRWRVELLARHPGPVEEMALPTGEASWPSAELWTFQAMPALRLVEIDNLPAIDGSQTNLPEDWRHLPTYQVTPGQSLHFKLLRRGDPEPEPNQLSLVRTLWLDFDGGGYTVNDKISGTMSRDWRLNALPETRLGQVQLNGQNQLLTRLDQSDGIEVRRGAIELSADSRIENGISEIAADGWQQRFQSLRAELNLPPGWRILAVTGVDNSSDTWLARWTLLDLFLVALAAIAAGRLWSPAWGGLALLGLILIWHEADAPRWLWLNGLAIAGLLRVVPSGRLARWLTWYRGASLAALVIVAVPFAIDQLRAAVYPQLAEPATINDFGDSMVSAGADAMTAAAPAELAETADAEEAPRRAYMRKALPMSAPISSAANLDRIDPDANLQTGPGLPNWHWQRVHLNWNGPVDSTEHLRFWYLPPWATALLRVLQTAIAALLVLRLTGFTLPAWRLGKGSVASLILILLIAPHPPVHAADWPDQALLEQLKTRLLEPPACAPQCAQIAEMQVIARQDTLTIELRIAAEREVAVPLPAKLGIWFPERIDVDGSPARTAIRREDGGLSVLVPAGVHVFKLQGRYANLDKFALPLPLAPRHVTLEALGWTIGGVYEDGLAGPQLEFSREPRESGEPGQKAAKPLPAFVRVERTLHLGLDWRVTTRIEPLVASGQPVLLELPLLPGEAVTSSEVRVKDGKVLINMAAGQEGLVWESLLEKSAHLTLKAPDTTQWTEVWRADVSPVWHLRIAGIAVVHHGDAGVWLPEWRPWPGETVELSIDRPAALAGDTLTIDHSDLEVTPGQRGVDSRLSLHLRSSKGGQHKLTLPAGAELQGVTIDGASQPIRQQGATLSLPIHPGEQRIEVHWQAAAEPGFWLETPQVDLGTPSVNSDIHMTIPRDRWPVWTVGPRFGPAALIWGLLVVLAGAAWGLAKIGRVPLGGGAWFLLLVGLSQLHIAAALTVVACLFALDWRARRPAHSRLAFNASQIGLALLGLLALTLLGLAVRQGLLGTPDMQIAGNHSDAYRLNWYQDRNPARLPTAGVVSLPIFAYHLLMLAWALWLARALLNWLRWAWLCWSVGGIWRGAGE